MEKKLFIPIILGTVRNGRKSEFVARYLEKRVLEHPEIETKLFDFRIADFIISLIEVLADVRLMHVEIQARFDRLDHFHLGEVHIGGAHVVDVALHPFVMVHRERIHGNRVANVQERAPVVSLENDDLAVVMCLVTKVVDEQIQTEPRADPKNGGKT